jgi:hypothetical protein
MILLRYVRGSFWTFTAEYVRQQSRIIEVAEKSLDRR